MELYQERTLPCRRIDTPSLLLVSLILVLRPPGCKPLYLFRSSPGGDNVKPAGLWGGRIVSSDDGAAENLYEIGYDRVETSTGALTGLDLSSVSYDSGTKKVIVEIERGGSKGKVIALGTPCKNAVPLSVLADGVHLADVENPYLVDVECGWKCGWNAFAFNDGKVYFVLSAVFGNHIALLNRQIQIRVLRSCSETPTAGVSFSILDCSELVSVLHNAPYEWPNPTLTVWAGSAMMAVPTGNDGQSPQLFVQLFNKTTSGVSMNLLQVVPSSEGAMTSILAHSLVPSVYSGSWRVRGLGEISHRQGVLCWTAAEELYCGQLQGSQLTHLTRMLDAGEAHNLGICTGDIYPLPIGRVLTGVAIASTRDPFEVYFGCYSEQSGVGGLGLLRLSSTHAGIQRQLLQVTSADSKVLGGALFIIDNLEAECALKTPDGGTGVTDDSAGEGVSGGCPSCTCQSKSDAMFSSLSNIMLMLSFNIFVTFKHRSDL